MRVEVRVNGDVILDVEREEVEVGIHNEVQDTGRGGVMRDFRPTGHHSVTITWFDREQGMEFLGLPAKGVQR